MSKQSKLTEVAPVLAEVVDAQRAGPHGDACHSCGSPVEKLDPFCGACGTPHSVTASVVQPYSQRESVSTRYASGTSSGVAVDSVTASNDGTTYGSDERANHKFFECKNCGATVSMDADHRSYVCAFCDSTYVAEYSPETTGRRRPDFVIGFEVTPEQAHEKFNQWINTNAWFRPGDLDQARVDERLVGVYLPFWSFSMLAKSEWSARIGEYWYRTETYTVKNAEGKTETRTRQVRETEWWSLTGQHQQYYTGYLVSGSKSLTQDEADQIKPYQLPAMKRYEPYFLAGWLCEEYSIPHQQALGTCQDVFLHREHSNVGAFMPGDTHRNLEVNTWFSYIHSDLCLLPAYVWSYRYRDQLYRFVVNGQTGRVTGQKPVSKTRITVFVIFILILIAIGVLVMVLGSQF